MPGPVPDAGARAVKKTVHIFSSQSLYFSGGKRTFLGLSGFVRRAEPLGDSIYDEARCGMNRHLREWPGICADFSLGPRVPPWGQDTGGRSWPDAADLAGATLSPGGLAQEGHAACPAASPCTLSDLVQHRV